MIEDDETQMEVEHLREETGNALGSEKMISTHDYVKDCTDAQKQYCEDLREAFKAVEQLILAHPASNERNFTARCLATARTHLEIACMYAIKGTVFEGKEVLGYGA